MTGGLVLVAISLFWQSHLSGRLGLRSFLAPGFVLMGVGMGFIMTPMSTAAMNAVDRTKAGVAGGILSMSRMVGGTLGVAVLAAFIGNPSEPEQFVASLGDGLLIGAIVAAVGARRRVEAHLARAGRRRAGPAPPGRRGGRAARGGRARGRRRVSRARSARAAARFGTLRRLLMRLPTGLVKHRRARLRRALVVAVVLFAGGGEGAALALLPPTDPERSGPRPPDLAAAFASVTAAPTPLEPRTRRRARRTRLLPQDRSRRVAASAGASFMALYREAARAFGVSWRLIASIHRQETAFSSRAEHLPRPQRVRLLRRADAVQRLQRPAEHLGSSTASPSAKAGARAATRTARARTRRSTTTSTR